MKKRPPITSRATAVPLDSLGGTSGLIQYLTVYVQVPTTPASSLWLSPGLDSSIIMAIISAWFGLSSFCEACWSSARAGTLSAADIRTVAKHFSEFLHFIYVGFG